MLQITFLTMQPSSPVYIDLLTTPFSRHAENGFFDHNPISAMLTLTF
jgi:hypothetical protein